MADNLVQPKKARPLLSRSGALRPSYSFEVLVNNSFQKSVLSREKKSSFYWVYILGFIYDLRRGEPSHTQEMDRKPISVQIDGIAPLALE